MFKTHNQTVLDLPTEYIPTKRDKEERLKGGQRVKEEYRNEKLAY
jgi:hypothetical protein